MEEITMKDMVNICKQYGFIYQGSEIYGGLANTWDYGPLGSLLKDNIKNTWKKRFIQERDNSYEVDIKSGDLYVYSVLLSFLIPSISSNIDICSYIYFITSIIIVPQTYIF